METIWFTTKEVAEKYPLLSERAQAQARFKRDVTYTKCAGKVIYKKEWIDEYLMKSVVKAAS